jgi:hypothetical protein
MMRNVTGWRELHNEDLHDINTYRILVREPEGSRPP